MQQQAAERISGLASQSQSSRDAIIAARAAPLLVSFLRSDQPAVQEITAGALWQLSAGSQENEDAIIAAGAVPQLVGLLRSDKPAVQQAF